MLHLCTYGCLLPRPLPEAWGRRKRRIRLSKATRVNLTATRYEVAAKLHPKAAWVSLRETLCSEGFDDKRGWRRMAALLGVVNAPFCR